MARIRWNNPEIIATAQRLTLPLVRRTSSQILNGARALAPEGDHRSGSGAVSKSVPLKFSLHESVSVGTTRIRSEIGSLVKHAATVHQGSAAGSPCR
jgi:hypothetical protein